LDDVSTAGGEMQVRPVHGDRSEPVSQSTKSHPAQQRAGTHVDCGHLKLSVKSDHHEHIGDSGEVVTGKINNLGVQHVPSEQQLVMLQAGIARGGVGREARSVDRECQLALVVRLYEPSGEQVPDAATAANPKAVDGWVRDVIEDRHVDDPAGPDTVGAADRLPQLTAQEHRRISAHSPYSPLTTA
jgi:hypothetical protein